jgi:ATP-dependent DNA ligase
VLISIDAHARRRYGNPPCGLCVRVVSPGFIPPCLPTAAPSAPSGDQGLHEIKHDGIRVVARKEDKRVKLFSRPGNDLTKRFPQIVEALARLRSRSCIIDGEAVACGDDGIALFDRIRYRRYDASVFMWAFDIIELNGESKNPQAPAVTRLAEEDWGRSWSSRESRRPSPR